MGEQVEVPTELVAGKYKLTRLLGRGGMGSVWEGVHNTLGTRVACKFIDSEYVDSGEAIARFENEARAAAALRSKHVVKVYDHGVSESGQPYIVMEFLSGEPLDARLSRLGRLPILDTAVIIMQVSRALTKAHEVGIVHRDLKPENVFLVWDDEDHADIVKVVDFGIAKFTESSAGISSATRTGSVLGTPYYMSPEQARGLRSVDHRSDLWSLGVIAFRCVVGRLPFEGEAIGDLLVKLCTAPIPVPSQCAPGVPPEFDAWLLKALAREPSERFQDAATLASELGQAAGAPSRGHMGSAVDRPSSVQSAGAATPYSQATFPTQNPALTTGARSGGVTNVALTHTPPPPVHSRRPMWLGVVAIVALLGVGGAALGGAFNASVGSETADDANSADPPPVHEPTIASPVVEPASAPQPPAEEAEPEPPSSASAASGDKPSQARKPAAKARVTPQRVAPATPAPVVQPAAPAPTAAPTPKPAPRPTAKPAPAAAPPKRRPPRRRSGIDVGY